MNFTEWYTGINDFRKCTFTPGVEQNEFVTEILENDFEPNRDLELIVLDHLLSIKSKKKEILFSGGSDSEFVLRVCMKYKIDFEVVIMKIYTSGFLFNTHDLYYAEKFVRENDIKHRFVKLDAIDFYRSGKYLEYLLPFDIDEPHVASHFWLIEQCSEFPIFGGDWFWVHTHLDNKIISPHRYHYSLYEQFMKSRNIEGIGNCLGHSFEANYRLIQLHIDAYNKLTEQKERWIIPTKIKQVMFNMEEPRIRSHGWNTFNGGNFFDVDIFKKDLQKIVKPTISKVVWGNKIADLLNSNTNENSVM